MSSFFAAVIGLGRAEKEYSAHPTATRKPTPSHIAIRNFMATAPNNNGFYAFSVSRSVTVENRSLPVAGLAATPVAWVGGKNLCKATIPKRAADEHENP
jgi:hypothetical protein